ncbi:hypothetical protein GCM10010124_17870 [Pilimelia terevasa]|uniref:Uncharacterized protein n=1 Tax=Pilimelia terevasa TaxID=53372 RepID=A0A8J3BMR8_9ACTN|nr:hypothetical protein [Pilimelia terevasa]GGK25733.1 hypothetical protein GCM10010124_17870 [Pilimelia terevasa]
MGDISAALTDMWRSVANFAPKAVAFLVILAVGWIVARVVRRVIGAVLERVGFDRLMRRGAVGQAMQRGRYDASGILARLAYYTLLLVTLQIAFGVFGANPVSTLINDVVAWLPNAFVAIVIVLVAGAIASAAKDLVTGSLGGLSSGRILGNVAQVFILGMGVIAALNQVGIAVTVTNSVMIAALATVAGIAVVGIGGGLIKPMAQRWEGWLQRAESESQTMMARSQGYQAGQADLDRQLADRTGAAAAPTATATAPTATATGADSGAARH